MDRLNKWAIGSIAVAIVTALTLMLGRTRPVEDHAVILSDGTSLRLLTVTMGTNHQAGLRFAHLFKILPETVAESIEGWIGNKLSGMSLQTSETNLVVWFEQKGSPWGTRVSRSVMLKASGGRISGEEQHAGFHLTTGQTNRIHSIRFRNWPRREEWIECDIFERDAQHENQKIGTFKFRNPTKTDRPSWTHDHSPTVQYAGDLKVTLQDFAAGINSSQMSTKNAAGIRETVYRPVESGSKPHALVDVEFESPRGTNETWILFNADLSDASGNTLRAGSRSGMNDKMLFSPVLWPDEEAWNLRLHIKRKTGFNSGELITFSNVPLPNLNSTNFPLMTNIVMGIESRLKEIRRSQALERGKTSWSRRDLSSIRLEHDDLGDTNQIDLLSLTAQPSGIDLIPRGSSWSNTHHEYQLASIPKEATHLDIVFSVQKVRFVDFVVAPNWVTNEYAISSHE